LAGVVFDGLEGGHVVSPALLSFSLTPVQSFIQASRTVRDLKGASLLLSTLTKAALKAGEDLGGTALFPAKPCGGWSDSIPNLFLMRFEDRSAANNAAMACAKAVLKRWREIATTVHAALAAVFRQHCKNWDDGWDYQIKEFWEIQTVVLPLTEVDNVLAEMLGLQGTNGQADLGLQFKAMQALLAAKKMVRHFPGDNGIGRHKCALMGELEQMGPAGLQASDNFWRAVTGCKHAGDIFLAPRDRLCAVSLVKRFAKLDPQFNSILSHRVPDTAAIATATWWKRARDEAGATKEADDFETAVTKLRKAIGEEADTERRYLLMDELTEGTAAAIAQREMGSQPNETVVEAFQAVARERAALVGRVKEYDKKLSDVTKRIGDPPRYYAILVQDGDEIGKWLSGQKCPVTEQFLRAMSLSLQCYAKKVADVISQHDGYLVYAGGDDALAMLPLIKALACACQLRKRFPDFRNGCNTAAAPTLSTGLAIVHHAYDLRGALRAARAAEERAKEMGRNALGIALVKRSGAPVNLVVDWSMVPRMLELQRLFEAGLSDRWLNKVAQDIPALLNWVVPRGAASCLIGYATKGLQLNEQQKVAVAWELSCDAERAEEEARQFVAQFWDEVWDRLAARHRLVPRSHPLAAECPLEDQTSFPAAALRQFVALGQVVSFLTRGRD